jgi:hypothetical protein
MTLKCLLSTQSPTTSKNFSHPGDFHRSEEAEMAVRDWLRAQENTSAALECITPCKNWINASIC